jgi:TPP-dependent 2-oxoacid decarboxylase
MPTIKSEIKLLIEEETDISILETVKTILKKTHQDPVLKEKLTQRAVASENDIKNDRILTREEVLNQVEGALQNHDFVFDFIRRGSSLRSN